MSSWERDMPVCNVVVARHQNHGSIYEIHSVGPGASRPSPALVLLVVRLVMLSAVAGVYAAEPSLALALRLLFAQTVVAGDGALCQGTQLIPDNYGRQADSTQLGLRMLGIPCLLQDIHAHCLLGWKYRPASTGLSRRPLQPCEALRSS